MPDTSKGFKMLSAAEIERAGYEITTVAVGQNGSPGQYALISPESREIMRGSYGDVLCVASSPSSAARPEITELGCYLDGANRGHYLARDIIDFATGHGFIVGPSDAYVVAAYEDHNSDDDYPFEVVSELSEEAIEWLNIGDNSGLDRPIAGQNSPPRVPCGAYWDVFDGSLMLAYPDTSEDDCTEHGFDECPDCGNVGTIVGKSGYEHCTRFLSCWTDSRIGRVDLPSDDASSEA